MFQEQEQIYESDPNEYILKLSKLNKSIKKTLPIQLISKDPVLEQELQKQLQINFYKYKKSTLLKQRIKLAQDHRRSAEIMKKSILQEYIHDKIKQSAKNREKFKLQQKEKRKIQRLTRQAMVKSKQSQLRSEKVKKSLEIIEKLQQKQKKGYNPFNSGLLTNQTSKSLKKRTVSLLNLPKIHKFSQQQRRISHQQQSPQSPLFTSEIDNSNNDYITSAQNLVKKMKQPSTKASKSKSSSSITLINHYQKNSSLAKKEEEILNGLIEQKHAERYNNFLERSSIGQKATRFSRHKQIKQAIQAYLKSHIMKVRVET